MIKFSKGFYGKVISIIVAVSFLVTANVYPDTLPASPPQHLRKQIDFNNKEKIIPRYLCGMLAAAIHKSILDGHQGENYKEILGTVINKYNLPNLLKEIEKQNIQIETDKEGTTWIYHEPDNIYIAVYKDGQFEPRKRKDLDLALSKNVSLHIYGELRNNGEFSDKDSIEQAIQNLSFEQKEELFLMLDEELVRKGFMRVSIQKRYAYLILIGTKERSPFIYSSHYIDKGLKQLLLETLEKTDSFASISKYILLNAIRRGEELFDEFEELPGMPRALIISSFENKELKPGSFLASPLGAYHLKSYLRFFGVKVDVYDPNMIGNMTQVKKDLESLITENNYQIIGSSTYQPTLIFDREIAEHLHSKFPDRLFIAGGEGADFNYPRLINESIYDATILGFGQYPLLDIAVNYTQKADFLERAKKIKNLRLRTDKEPILTGLAFEYSAEDYEVLSMSFNFREIPFEDYWRIMEENLKGPAYSKMRDPDAIYTVRLFTSSHCPMGCSFCTSTHFLNHAISRKTQRVRMMSAEQIITQMELVDRYHPRTRTIFFNDDDFLINRQRIIELCRLIKERFGNKRFKFIILGRVDKIDEELLNRMREAGVIQINYGIEHFSDRVLKHMNKKITAEQNIKGIRTTLKSGILPIINLILFYPTATMEDVRITIERTVELAREGAGISYWPMVEAFEGATIIQSAKEGVFQIQRFEDWKNDFIVPQDSETRKVCFAAMQSKPQVVEEIRKRHGLSSKDKLPHVVDVLCFFLAVYKGAGYDYEFILKTIDEKMNNSAFLKVVAAIESNETLSIDSILAELPEPDRRSLFEKIVTYEDKTSKRLWKVRAAAYAYAVAQSLGQKQMSQGAFDRTFMHIFELVREAIAARSGFKETKMKDYNKHIPTSLQDGSWLILESPVRVEIESQLSDLLVISLMKYEISQVMNLSVNLDGIPPVRVRVRRIDDLVIRLSSKDLGITEEVTSLEQLFEDLSDIDKEPLRLLKGAIVASGIVPSYLKESKDYSLADILQQLGGSFELITEVRGIPEHSGLGVSSVLGGTVLLALQKFSGQGSKDLEIAIQDIEDVVEQGIFLEQLIGVGGGYQDFFGLVGGLKHIQAQQANVELQEIAPGDIVPVFHSLNLQADTMEKLQEGMVLWDQGAHIPVSGTLQTIVMNFLLGRDQAIRKEWQILFTEISEALSQGNLEKIGELQSRSFELRREICKIAWPEPLDIYVNRIEEELKKYFGSDYYGSDNSGGRPGAARIAFINANRRDEFKRVALEIAQGVQKEILDKSKDRGWMDVYFEAPKIYNFDINTVGVIANIEPALTSLSDSITNKTKELFTGI